MIYHQELFQLLRARGDELDEEQIVKSVTGIHNPVVWRKLFKFQRDGVVGVTDKLNRFGGCIIADSVGLGKLLQLRLSGGSWTALSWLNPQQPPAPRVFERHG